MKNRKGNADKSESEITKTIILDLLEAALELLYTNDKYLIDNQPFNSEKNGSHHVGERSIVFRLAHYMQNQMTKDAKFNDYVLDCEYNRNGNNAKILPSFPNGVYPDIIIHQRGNNEHNLLVLEVKTYWNADTENDNRKLQELVNKTGIYKFKFGISLVITQEKTLLSPQWIG